MLERNKRLYMVQEILCKTDEGGGLARPDLALLELAAQGGMGHSEEAAFFALHGMVMAGKYILKEDAL